MTNIREARHSNRVSIRGGAPVISRVAHVIQRIGLAMAGALCGLFVAALMLRANIDLFDSFGLAFAMMLFGLIGFYLGIDTTPPPSRASRFDILDARLGPKIELLPKFCGGRKILCPPPPLRLRDLPWVVCKYVHAFA